MGLLDAIRQFKARRQKSSQPVPCSVEAELSDLVDIYRTVRGMVEGPELVKLKVNFANRWDKLTEDEQKMLVKQLRVMQLLPTIIEKALKIFKGKMLRLI